MISTNSGDQNGLKIPLNSPKIIQAPSQPRAHDVPFLRAIALFIFFLATPVSYGILVPRLGIEPRP